MKTIYLYYLLIALSSCVSTETNYKFNRYDLNEKTLLCHKQTLKGFLGISEPIKIYWAKVPKTYELKERHDDSIAVIKIEDSLRATYNYKTVLKTLGNENFKLSFVKIFEIYNKEKFALYVMEPITTHSSYDFIFKTPTQIYLIYTSSDKFPGTLSCSTLFNQLDLFINELLNYKIKVSQGNITRMKKVLNNAVEHNKDIYNTFRTVNRYEEPGCLK